MLQRKTDFQFKYLLVNSKRECDIILAKHVLESDNIAQNEIKYENNVETIYVESLLLNYV